MQIWNSPDLRRTVAGEMSLSDTRPLEGTHGFVDTMVVATGEGWSEAKDLVPGDQVLTLNAGMQTLLSVEVSQMADRMFQADPAAWPLFVPMGTLGNAADVVVMPGQSLLLESNLAADLIGNRFVLIQASDLDLLSGVMRLAPSAGAAVISLTLAKADVVYGAGGALFACAGAERGSTAYPVLTASEANMILNHEILPSAASGHWRQESPPPGC